jgi:hypothetical protein
MDTVNYQAARRGVLVIFQADAGHIQPGNLIPLLPKPERTQ